MAFDFFLTSPPDVFITQDSEKTRAIMQAAWFGSARDCPPIVQLSDTLPTTCAGVINYQMNYARLGRMIADHIRQPTEQGECSTIIPNVGFPWCGQSSQSPESNATLNMLILPSPSTDALRKLLPHFYRTSGIKVNLAIYPYDEVFEILSNLHLHPYYDLLRIDMACLPWFADKVLLPLEAVSDEAASLLDNFSPTIKQHFSQVNGTSWALPFIHLQEVLAIRI